MKLAPMELAVMSRLAVGTKTKKVAEELGISWYTAREYIKNATRRTGAHSVLEALEIAGIKYSPSCCTGGLVDFIRREVKRRDTQAGCWIWPFRLHRSGYAIITRGNRRLQAACFAYDEFYGTITLWRGRTVQACHRCDNPACFNPAHIFVGTQQDNMDDKVRKGRHRRNQYTHI